MFAGVTLTQQLGQPHNELHTRWTTLVEQEPHIKDVAVLVFFAFVEVTHIRSGGVDWCIGAKVGRAVSPFFKGSHTRLPPLCW